MNQNEYRDLAIHDETTGDKQFPHLIKINPDTKTLEFIDIRDWKIANGRIEEPQFLAKMYELIGCSMIESVTVNADGTPVTFYCDEEFLYAQPLKPMNVPASVLYQGLILGTVIVTGGFDREGYDLPLYGVKTSIQVMDYTAEHAQEFLLQLLQGVNSATPGGTDDRSGESGDNG